MRVALEYRGVIGPVIRKHREQTGESKPKFALRLGYGGTRLSNGQTLENVESGKQEPTVSMLLRYCEILGPDFADDLAAEFFKAAQNGMRNRRDALLDEAQVIAVELRDRKRRPMPKPEQIEEGVS